MSRIERDLYPDNPREDYDHLGTFWGWHRRYRSPDEGAPADPVPIPPQSIGYKVYLYDHSGTAYSTEPFSCPWDSGQFGIIWVSKAKIRQEYDVRRISRNLVRKVQKILKAEVEEWNCYANGEVYIVDGVGGYYGMDAALAAAKEAA